MGGEKVDVGDTRVAVTMRQRISFTCDKLISAGSSAHDEKCNGLLTHVVDLITHTHTHTHTHTAAYCTAPSSSSHKQPKLQAVENSIHQVDHYREKRSASDSF